jgi:hypothetical protein
MRAIALLLVIAMCSCATLEPNSIRLYGEHVSHATQHLQNDPTDYGYNTVNLELHYKVRGVFLDLSEGINLNAKDKNVPWAEYGALDGPREVFQARFGYEWQVKP